MAANRRARARQRSTSSGRTLSAWLPYWENELGARGCSPRTVDNQRKCIKRLSDFVGDVDPRTLAAEHLTEWRDALRATLRDTSVNRYVLTVGTFFNWLAGEGVIPESPALGVPLLKVRETAPPVLDAEALRRITKGTRTVKRGRSAFEALRDETIVSLLQDSGLRASECAGLLVANLNLPARQVLVHGDIAKGGYERAATFGFQTARLLGRYLRERETHSFAFLPELFVGRRGALGYHGIWEMVRKAAKREGVIGARPHLYRHTFAHDMKQAGVSDEVLMSLAGWRTPAMLRRYGRAEQASRALEAYQRLGSPVDRGSVTKRADKAPTKGKRRTA